MKLLELFSGTHSIGKVASKMGFDVYSLDRDLGDTNDGYTSKNHFQVDILDFDYKQFPSGYFDVITASPVCSFWSILLNSHLKRKNKNGVEYITREIIEENRNIYAKPMVDKMFEIIEYFKPKHYWIENPSTSAIKSYINEKYPKYSKFNVYDYCYFSDWGYRKRTNFWNNIDSLENHLCLRDKCINVINGRHIAKIGRFGENKTTIRKLNRYRIPPKLIEYLLNNILAKSA